MESTIFVQMASYKDPELFITLTDMISQAKYPELLHIGICWQHGDDQTTEDFMDNGFDIMGFDEDFSHIEDSDRFDHVLNVQKDGAKLTIIDVDYNRTKGACWARHAIQQIYGGEKYTLQLDSHDRFVENWDEISVEMLENLRSDECPKPLLTGYIPSFNPENEPNGRIHEAWKMDFDRFIPEGAVFFRPSTIENWSSMDKPVPSRFYSAHFCFTDGKFVEEVQHDPQYFFHGEEISIAVRAFTHGYDLYHPHRVIAWHEYTRKGRIKVWDDHTTPEKDKGNVELDWVERNNNCHKRNRILFGMDGEDPNQVDFGKYGFGDVRTLREYEEYAGISFEHRGVQQKTLDNIAPPNNHPYTTEKEWRDSFCRSNDVRILFHKNDVGDACDDYDFCYVGAHDVDDKEIFREDITGKQLKNHLRNEWTDFRLIFLSDHIPTTFTVWPHSKSRGWMNKITRPVE
jgi:hypothetical protein